MRENTVGRASLWGALAAASSLAASFGFTTLVARSSGLAALGDFALLSTVLGVAAVVDSARTQHLTARTAAGLVDAPVSGVPRFATAAGAAGILVGIVAGAAGAFTAAAAIAMSAAAGVHLLSSRLVARHQAAARYDRIAVASLTGSIGGLAAAGVLVGRLGLAGVGLGVLTTAVVSRGALRLRPPPLPARGSATAPPSGEAGALRSLIALTGLAQLLSVIDVVAVRLLASAQEAGRYRAGVQVPTQAVGLLFRGFDAIFPRLASLPEDVACELLRHAARRFAVLLGVVVGGIVASRHLIVELVLGSPDATAARVLVVFTGVWVVNNTVHGPALLLIARRRQAALLPVVTMEFAANVVLTAALVVPFGAVGSAAASLVTLVVSNALFLPRVLQRELPELPVVRHMFFDALAPCLTAAAGVIAMSTLL